jgi:pheromone shutdown protein TraB
MHWTIIQITRKIQIYLKRLRRTCQCILKVRMFQKVLLSTDSSERRLIDIQWVYSSFVDDSYKNRCITMKCETAVSEMNADVKENQNALN